MTTISSKQVKEVTIPIATPIRVLAAVQAASGVCFFVGTLLASLYTNPSGQIDLVSPSAVLVALIGGTMLIMFASAQVVYANHLEPEEDEEDES